MILTHMATVEPFYLIDSKNNKIGLCLNVSNEELFEENSGYKNNEKLEEKELKSRSNFPESKT